MHDKFKFSKKLIELFGHNYLFQRVINKQNGIISQIMLG